MQLDCNMMQPACLDLKPRFGYRLFPNPLVATEGGQYITPSEKHSDGQENASVPTNQKRNAAALAANEPEIEPKRKRRKKPTWK